MEFHKCKIKVRYAETDQMGVVHHSVYPIYYEQARVQMMEDNNFSMAHMEKDTNIVLPVKNINLNYMFPAYFGDELTVETIIRHASKVKLLIECNIHNQDNVLVNKAEIKLGFSDKDTGKIVRIPDYYLDKFKALEVKS
jgi:acyl-CoA thioester hydrolase